MYYVILKNKKSQTYWHESIYDHIYGRQTVCGINKATRFNENQKDVI